MANRNYEETEYHLPKSTDLGSEYHQPDLVEEAALTGKLEPSRATKMIMARKAKRAANFKMIMALFVTLGITTTGTAAVIPADGAEPVAETVAEVLPVETSELLPDVEDIFTELGEEGDDAFPVLGNLMPGGSSEQVLLFEDMHSMNEAGEYYTPQDEFYYLYYVGEFAEFNPIRTVPGASYDPATNTLTLNNCTFEGGIYATRMGNGFTIRLIGDNRVGSIYVDADDYREQPYAASLTFTGDGKLTVKSNDTYLPPTTGVWLSSRGGDGCIMIDKDVTLDIYGDTYAMHSFDTTQEKGIYYLKPNAIQTEGIKRSDGVVPEGGSGKDKNYTFYGEDETDNVNHILISPEKEDD